MRHAFAALAAATVMTPPAVTAAPAGPSGYYYEIPIDVHKNASGSSREQPDEVTSETAQLLVYNRDDGTTAVQLKITAPSSGVNSGPGISAAVVFPQSAVSAYSIHRDDFPAAASYVFGTLDKITIPFQPMNRHMQGQSANVVDLTGPDGQPVGDRYQFSDASGEPLRKVSVEISIRTGGSRGDVTTSTADLDSEGKLTIPRPRFLFQGGGYSSPSLADITFTEPESGTRLSLDNQVWQGFNRQPGTSTTVPFLNDWAAPPDNVDVYIGQLFNDDDTPASGTKFSVYSHAYQRDPFGSPYRDLTAGPGGYFRLAFQRPDQSGNPAGLFYRGEPSITLRFEGSTQSHQLKPGREIEVRKKREATVSLEFLDDKGEPMDLTTTRALAQQVGVIYGSSDAGSRRPDMNHQIVIADGEVQPVKLIVPASYYALARGYAFQEEHVDIGETSVTFRPKLADFELKGRIADLSGKAVAGAIVMASDVHPLMELTRLSADEQLEVIKDAFTATNGDFDKLGVYIAETENDGTFKIAGNSLSTLSRLVVMSEDYGFLSVAPLPEQVPDGPSSAPMRMHSDTERMKGTHDYGTIRLAREATATLILKEDPVETTRTQGPRSVIVQAEFLKTGAKAKPSPPYMPVDRHMWHTNQTVDGDTISVSVPAETTATINIMSDRSGKYLQYNIDILDPLEPGEVRELGVIEQKDGKPWER